MRPLENRFDCHQVRGFDVRHYQTVQGFAKLAEGDMRALLEHLGATNAKLVLDVINKAAPRDAT